ncbi:GNAT family N-acetyltransferase [Cellulosimicrobium sp. NPDC057127]|uniref:GNAT family N-acetyltransferase n=1 Tax=Cellulosimicrobium sp. NPDC057127 TaxID=3346026 RepID=UPI003642C9F8
MAEARGWHVVDVLADDDALVVHRTLPGRGDVLWGVGSADAAARLLLDAGERFAPGVARSALPRGTTAAARGLAARTGRALPAHLRTDPVSAWDWFWTAEPPPYQTGEERVVGLVDEADRAAARALLDDANPAAELDPAATGTHWWGWADDTGALRAVAGARCPGPGVPWEIGGVATHPAWRGRGLARAVTAAATRAALREADVVALGMYADNDAARQVYGRLGYVVGQRFESRR